MNRSEYVVIEVDEGDLPEGHDWILIDEPHRVTFAYARGRLSPQALADGWAAYRRVMRQRMKPTPSRHLRAV
jgi:hypothetical protein